MKEKNAVHRIYTDGSGDGRMAWVNETTGDSWSGREQGLTNNEAEYLAIFSALKSAKHNEVKKVKEVEILSDSKLVVNQLNREWHIKDDRMRKLFDKVHQLIREKRLNVRFTWVPRKDNLAGKYLG